MNKDAVKLKQTTCPYCGVGCGIDVKINAQTLTQVTGSSEHPANFGRLCVKGSSVLQTNDVSGRLLQPMIGDSRVSWDEAFTKVATKFKQVIDEHGPDSVAFYVSGQLLTEDYYVANKLMKGFIGSANIDTNSRLCMSSAVSGYKRAFGADAVPCNYQDLEDTELLVLIGSNAAWTHPVLYQRIERAKQLNPNKKIIVIDPRRTASCELADLHLALKPGTDVILLNGLLNYLSANNELDQAYIEQATLGFEQALNEASAYTPEHVAMLCELPLADVLAYYQWFAKAASAVTFYCMGVNQSIQGTDKCNAIINCHLASGKIGKPGSGPFSITGQPNAMGGREVGGLATMLAAHMELDNPTQRELLQTFWRSPRMADKAGYKATDIFKNISDGKIKAVWIMATNPAVSLPDGHSISQALKNCEMVVVSDCNLNTDTSHWADVRLPATGWSEKNGTVTNSERRISRQRGLLPPAGESKHDWQIICEVAKAMGFNSGFNYAHPCEIFDEFARLSGIENKGSRAFDISGLAGLSEQEYDALRPIQWPVNHATPEGTARLFTDRKFYTLSGKAHFVATQAKRPAQIKSEEYPFICNTGRIRDQWHTMTRTGKAASLSQHISEPYLAIHPRDAEQLMLEAHQVARVKSAQGECLVRVKLDEGQRRGDLFMPMHWNKMFASSANVNQLLNTNIDPVSGQPEFKHTAVHAEKFAADYYGVIYSREAVTADSEYWAKAPTSAGHQLVFAGTKPVEDWLSWCQQHSLVQGEWFKFENKTEQASKIFCYRDNRLEYVCYVQRQPISQDNSWLNEMFLLDQFSGDEINAVLCGAPSEGMAKGRQICSCFKVGEKQIIEAIQTEGDETVEALGQRLKCGTNCGSCKPDLAALIREHGENSVIMQTRV
ncbi:nitrate reductase [Gayadomonas joobiniege]|uniref:nitrate reductase n=1 Tax=Gayadomonas joobiniege TaxID=1234606 RepID=UPI000474A8D9|nr:nitrate reductase [Gayadomonas joobiniege]